MSRPGDGATCYRTSSRDGTANWRTAKLNLDWFADGHAGRAFATFSLGTIPRQHSPRMVTGDFVPRGNAIYRLKGLRTAADLAAKLGADSIEAVTRASFNCRCERDASADKGSGSSKRGCRL
jgi:hypothetical protein